MRLIIILTLFCNIGFSQTRYDLNPNTRYFSRYDTILYNSGRIKTQKINTIKIFFRSKYYGDTLLLSDEYKFNPDGILIEEISFDIDGKMNFQKFELDVDGRLLEINTKSDSDNWKNSYKFHYDNRNQLVLVTQNQKKIDQYFYSDNGLLVREKYFLRNINVDFEYDSLDRKIFEEAINLKEDYKVSTSYQYDSTGNLIYTKNIQPNYVIERKLSYNLNHELIQKSVIMNDEISSKEEFKYLDNKEVMLIYDNGRFEKKIIRLFTKDYKLKKYIYDDRQNVEKVTKRNRKKRHYVPPRYRKIVYRYDREGNLIFEKYFGNPVFWSGRVRSFYDKNQNLAKKIFHEKGRKKRIEVYYYTFYN